MVLRRVQKNLLGAIVQNAVPFHCFSNWNRAANKCNQSVGNQFLLRAGQSSWGKLKKEVVEGVGKADKWVKAVKEDEWRRECHYIPPGKKNMKKGTYTPRKAKGTEEKNRRQKSKTTLWWIINNFEMERSRKRKSEQNIPKGGISWLLLEGNRHRNRWSLLLFS